MKQKLLKIRQEMEKIIGTPAWAVDQLEMFNKTIEEGDDEDTPCIFYTDHLRNNERIILCCPYDGTYDPNYLPSYRLCEDLGVDEVMVLHSDSLVGGGMFEYLTPKAQRIVDDFVEKVAVDFMNRLGQIE